MPLYRQIFLQYGKEMRSTVSRSPTNPLKLTHTPSKPTLSLPDTLNRISNTCSDLDDPSYSRILHRDQMTYKKKASTMLDEEEIEPEPIIRNGPHLTAV
jgi:hypothetical protein